MDEEDAGLPGPPAQREDYRRAGAASGGRLDLRHDGSRPRRVIKYLALAIGAWLLLSLVLFIVSAQIETGQPPGSAERGAQPPAGT